jgi:polysaccharide export outer membrane protein
VIRVNSRKYIIQGEVNRPGIYSLTAPTTILEALVNGGGFRDFANTKKIYVLRGTQKLTFNYKEVSHGKRTEQNVLVENGDQIFVP